MSVEERIAALESVVERYIIKGERPMVCKYCNEIFQWLTIREQGFTVYRYPVCMRSECRARFAAERQDTQTYPWTV